MVYIGLVEKNIYKFGFTNDIKTRLIDHRSQLSKDFKPEYIIETIYNREVEKDIKLNLEHLIIYKKYHGKLKKNLF